MTDVRANIGANTQGAEGALKRVLDMLRNLRRESESFRGDIQITQPEEVAKLTSALQDALKTAREFSRVDFSRFNADLGRSVQQLQKNVQLYLQAQKSLNPAVQQRFTQFLAGGGNPLAPNFQQMFPTLQGPALQQQMQYYFKSILRNTGMPMPQLHAGGGAAGGSPTGARDAGGDQETARLRRLSAREEYRYWMRFRRTAGGMAGQGANFLTQTSGLGSFGGFGVLGLTGGILGVAAKGFSLARETGELKDQLFRQTEDTGAALDKLTENLDRAGDAFGQSTREVLQTAQTWARAAYQSDVRAIEQGYTGAAGFARAHGLDPGQTAASFGSLRHYGLGSGDKGEQQKFAMLLGQTIRDSGMKSAPDQVVNELRDIASQLARTTGRGLSATETDAYLRFRTSVSQDPILKGVEGAAAIGSLDSAFRGTGGLPQEVFWAEALAGAGVTGFVEQKLARSRGIFTDLSAPDIGGRGTALDAVMQHARQRYGDIDPNVRNAALTDVFGMSPDMVGKFYDAYFNQAEPGSLNRTVQRLEGRGFKFSDMREDAISQILDAEGLDLSTGSGRDALKGMMERYATDMVSKPNKRSDADDDANRLRAAVASGDPAQMRDLYQDIVAKHGMQSTPASELREAAKGLESSLTKLGEGIVPLVAGVASLADGIPELSQNIKELTEAIRQWSDDPVGKAADATRSSLGLTTQAYVSAQDRAQRDINQSAHDTNMEFVGRADAMGYIAPNGQPSESAPPYVAERLKKIGPHGVTHHQKKYRQQAGSAPAPTTSTGAPAPPAATTTGAAAPAAPSGAAITGGEDLVPGTQAWKDYLLSLDRQHGFPEGTMLSVAMQESSNRNLGYHYPEDANGKRKSTAYGPFGILDSTAADPGYGVKPLQDRTPAEQARFAADYLAARTRANGGDLRQGLISYSTGEAAYADSVLKRAQAAGSARPKPTGTPTASGAFKVDGLNIDYRGDPNFQYGKTATAKAEPFRGIVFHHTGARGAEGDIDAMVRYGKTVDKERGGAFGYHFYVDREGNIVQGAPLDKRTNHIKPGSSTGLTNSNAIGISLVGVEDGVPASEQQMAAATRLGSSLQQQLGLDPRNAWGHGEIQGDRQKGEGKVLAERLRRSGVTGGIAGLNAAEQGEMDAATLKVLDAPAGTVMPFGGGEEYVSPDVVGQATAQQKQSKTSFGELTLNINQRVNGQSQGQQTQRLTAGTGADIPRMHGDVDIGG